MEGLYRLKKDDIPKASVVLSRAFIDDPDMKRIVPDDSRRQEKLQTMFAPFVKFGLLFGEVYAPSQKMEGVIVWNHSSRKENNFIRSLMSGFLGMISRLDPDQRKIFTRYGKEIDTGTSRTISQEHWFLFILGVDPEHQRSGMGRKMLESMLERIDGEGLPVMLDTNKWANVDYYSRFGFRVKNRYLVLENDHWGLVRPPVKR